MFNLSYLLSAIRYFSIEVYILPPPKEVMFLVVLVCLYDCLFAYPYGWPTGSLVELILNVQLAHLLS